MEGTYNQVLEFATRAHEGQFRLDGKPYVTHPIAVAEMVREKCIGHTDVVEDTDVTIDQIREEFGDRVADYVAEVTDAKGLTPGARRRAQYDKAVKMSHGASAIKLADMAHNLRSRLDTPELFDPERNRLYFIWKAMCWTQFQRWCHDVPFAELFFEVRRIFVRAEEMGVYRHEDVNEESLADYFAEE